MNADVRMRGFGQRATVTEVLDLIAGRIAPLGTERTSFRFALGRILGEDIVATHDIPPFRRAAVDGYALRRQDLPGKFKIVDEITANERLRRALGRNEAVRIMAGARVPDEADIVVKPKDVQAKDPNSKESRVAIDVPPAPAPNILERGEDVRAGRVVLPRSRTIRAEDLAMMAALGALEVLVQRKPRVRIVPTGSELVCVGNPPGGGEIVESNSDMLASLARRDGAEPILHPIAPDDEDLLARTIQAPDVDVVVLSGGSSVGVQDLAPIVVSRLGDLPVHGIAVEPASATGVGFVDQRPVVLTPGYPAACLVAWDLFVRPIVRRMLAAKDAQALPYPTIRARLARAYEKPEDRTEVVRVTLANMSDGLPLASVVAGGAALISTLTRADGFLLLPAGQSSWPTEAEVEVHLQT